MTTEPTIVPLRGGALACAACGVAVPRTEADQHGIEVVTSYGRETPPGQFRPRHSPLDAETETRLTRCAPCAETREQAQQLIAEHPGPIRIGDLVPQGALAVEVVTNALTALAAIGETVSINSARELRLLVGTLAPHGARLTWRSRFVPRAELSAQSNTAAARPFAHVAAEQLDAVRTEFSRFRVLRVERPTKLTPPVGVGCYLCGVGSIEALPSQRAAAWRVEQVRPAQLGGHDAGRIEASVCGDCANARRAEEALGLCLVERLVLAEAGVARMLGGEGIQLNGITAWGTSGRMKPNRSRFAHLDLDGLRHQVATGQVSR